MECSRNVDTPRFRRRTELSNLCFQSAAASRRQHRTDGAPDYESGGQEFEISSGANKTRANDVGARDGIEHRDGIAGPIDEQLLAGHMRLAHRRRDALAPVAVPLAEPTVGVASSVLPRYSCQSSASVTPRRFICVWMRDQSGSVRAADEPAAAGGNNRRSRSASSISSGIGQLRPATAARRTYSPTAVLPIPVASPTSRRLIPIACVRRSASA